MRSAKDRAWQNLVTWLCHMIMMSLAYLLPANNTISRSRYITQYTLHRKKKEPWSMLLIFLLQLAAAEQQPESRAHDKLLSRFLHFFWHFQSLTDVSEKFNTIFCFHCRLAESVEPEVRRRKAEQAGRDGMGRRGDGWGGGGCLSWWRWVGVVVEPGWGGEGNCNRVGIFVFRRSAQVAVSSRSNKRSLSHENEVYSRS